MRPSSPPGPPLPRGRYTVRGDLWDWVDKHGNPQQRFDRTREPYTQAQKDAFVAEDDAAYDAARAAAL